MPQPFNERRIADLIAESVATKQQLASERTSDIRICGEMLATCAASNRLIMFCGNGGCCRQSAPRCRRVSCSVTGGIERRAIAALALTVDTSVLTAGGNDYGFDNVFKRQVEAFGTEGDVLVAITTSGTSKNIVMAVEEAKKRGVLTIGLLGGTGGILKDMCDASVVVPSTVTARIQESHILIGHIWCEMIEEAIAPELF
ncbi:MAG: SIS domain-containing protein [Ignavibacteria bacterium]|nr:SIS domain-containing protein [Ignavibacteria bacterium]